MSETIQTLILSAHLLVGILLVAIILIQRGKGSDAGMAFGGGASGTVFGAAGSGTFLTKTTKWLAISFFCTSLALAYVHNQRIEPESVLDRVEQTEATQPGDFVVPGAEAAPVDLPDVAPAELPTDAEAIPAAELEEAAKEEMQDNKPEGQE